MNKREFVNEVVSYARQYQGDDDGYIQYKSSHLVNDLYTSYEQLYGIVLRHNPLYVFDVGSGVGMLKNLDPSTYSSNSRRHKFFTAINQHMNIPMDYMFDNVDEPDWFNLNQTRINVGIVSRFYPFIETQHPDAESFCRIYNDILQKVDRFIVVRHYLDLEKYVDLKPFRMHNVFNPTYLIPCDAVLRPLNV